MTLDIKNGSAKEESGTQEPKKRQNWVLTHNRLAEVLASPCGLSALYARAVTFAAARQRCERISSDDSNDECAREFLFDLLELVRDWQKTIEPERSLAEFVARIEALPVRAVSDYVEAIASDSTDELGSATGQAPQSESRALSAEASFEFDDHAIGATRSTSSSPSSKRSGHQQLLEQAPVGKQRRQRLRRASGFLHASSSSTSAERRASAEQAQEVPSDQRTRLASESDQEADQIDAILDEIARRGRKTIAGTNRERTRTYPASSDTEGNSGDPTDHVFA
ncbi:hypothetical protein CCYA_CCYA01G0154 [Cyanidiococcus yangmingshanensis]|nr:hypothetical protein CCYA_CCYA01G0154 [Cyanidiococcus yangmingshanensis]